MTVSAVGSHDNSKLNTIVKSTAVGMVGGYALKYLYPVQKQEDNISRRSMLNLEALLEQLMKHLKI